MEKSSTTILKMGYVLDFYFLFYHARKTLEGDNSLRLAPVRLNGFTSASMWKKIVRNAFDGIS